MNEISKQIIEIGKLIGKKVFIKHCVDGNYYTDTDRVIPFTIYDFEEYAYKILVGEIELIEINLREKFGVYYLVTFKDL